MAYNLNRGMNLRSVGSVIYSEGTIARGELAIRFNPVNPPQGIENIIIPIEFSLPIERNPSLFVDDRWGIYHGGIKGLLFRWYDPMDFSAEHKLLYETIQGKKELISKHWAELSTQFQHLPKRFYIIAARYFSDEQTQNVLESLDNPCWRYLAVSKHFKLPIKTEILSINRPSLWRKKTDFIKDDLPGRKPKPAPIEKRVRRYF